MSYLRGTILLTKCFLDREVFKSPSLRSSHHAELVRLLLQHALFVVTSGENLAELSKLIQGMEGERRKLWKEALMILFSNSRRRVVSVDLTAKRIASIEFTSASPDLELYSVLARHVELFLLSPEMGFLQAGLDDEREVLFCMNGAIELCRADSLGVSTALKRCREEQNISFASNTSISEVWTKGFVRPFSFGKYCVVFDNFMGWDLCRDFRAYKAEIRKNHKHWRRQQPAALAYLLQNTASVASDMIVTCLMTNPASGGVDLPQSEVLDAFTQMWESVKGKGIRELHLFIGEHSRDIHDRHFRVDDLTVMSGRGCEVFGNWCLTESITLNWVFDDKLRQAEEQAVRQSAKRRGNVWSWQ